MTNSHTGSGAVQAALIELSRGHDLDEATSGAAFAEIMAGGTSPALISALLMGIRVKGESASEIAGAVRALRGAMRRVGHPAPESLVDTCGTGGGTVSTINISTAAAFVAAGAGIPVAKHGNRSFTSRSGSADVLESLAVPIDLEPLAAERVLAAAGIVFLFAPTYHPAMRHVGPVRQELGVQTIMNLIGPLANPAEAGRQVVGVADATRAPTIAAALSRLGTVHGLVVHAEIGMDEIAPVGLTTLWEVRDGTVREWQFDPRDAGLATPTTEGIEGGDPADNAARIIALLERPAQAPAALRAAILLNAAAAIYVGGGASSLVDAAAVADDALTSGRARERLELLREASRLR